MKLLFLIPNGLIQEPLIKKQVPNVSFSIAGKHSEPLSKSLKAKLLHWEPDIQLLGFVQDLLDHQTQVFYSYPFSQPLT